MLKILSSRSFSSSSDINSSLRGVASSAKRQFTLNTDRSGAA